MPQIVRREWEKYKKISRILGVHLVMLDMVHTVEGLSFREFRTIPQPLVSPRRFR